MNCIIVDDDLMCINTMESFIANFIPDMKVLGRAQTINEATELINKVKPQVVFLDVELNGELGFRLFDIFPEPSFEVIFCTAHEKYAVKAIKLSCFDFLIKPVLVEDLQAAVNKLQNKLNSSVNSKRIQVLLDNFVTKEYKKIAIPSSNSIEFINTADIVCCEAESKYTTVYTVQGEKIVSSKNIGEFEELLNPELFFRSHKSWLVNLSFVKKFIKTENKLLLSNNMQIDVSTRKKDEFLSLFEKL